MIINSYILDNRIKGFYEATVIASLWARMVYRVWW